MHHRWLLLAACFWVIFMFMVASKFITLTFKDPDVHGAKQEPMIPTTITEVRKGHITKEKRLSGQFQTIGKGLSEDLVHEGLVHMERLELLRNVCQDASLKNLTHTTVSKFVLDRIFVCDKHKILFCQTPKVGNTQWKKVLIVLNGAFPSIDEIPENIVHDHEKNGLPRLSSFSDSNSAKDHPGPPYRRRKRKPGQKGAIGLPALPFQEASGRRADLSPATHVRCGWQRACAPCSPGWRLGGLSRAVLPSAGEDELYNGSELHKRPSPEIVAVACSGGSREEARAVRFSSP